MGQLLWLLAFAISALLVIRFGAWGVIGGMITIWAAGWAIYHSAFKAGDLGQDGGGLGVITWILGVGWVVGAAWTLPIFAIRSFIRYRRRRRSDCSADLA